MSEAYIIDAIRTPRGKGKKDGSLHEVKPITLLTTLLNEYNNAINSTPLKSMISFSVV